MSSGVLELLWASKASSPALLVPQMSPVQGVSCSIVEAVCKGGNSISPLVHNHLSACNSNPTSTWAWRLLHPGAGWIPKALRPEKLTGDIGREGKPEQTSKGSPLLMLHHL